MIYQRDEILYVYLLSYCVYSMPFLGCLSLYKNEITPTIPSENNRIYVLINNLCIYYKTRTRGCINFNISLLHCWLRYSLCSVVLTCFETKHFYLQIFHNCICPHILVTNYLPLAQNLVQFIQSSSFN